jgi:hypothetical protein
MVGIPDPPTTLHPSPSSPLIPISPFLNTVPCSESLGCACVALCKLRHFSYYSGFGGVGWGQGVWQCRSRLTSPPASLSDAGKPQCINPDARVERAPRTFFEDGSAVRDLFLDGRAHALLAITLKLEAR